MNFIKRYEVYIKDVLDNLGYELDDVKLIKSSKPEFGMYQFNGAMMLSKKYRKNPLEIAGEIKNILDNNEDFSDVNIQGAGFINITFSNSSLINYMNQLISDIKIGINKYPSKKIVLDYGGANVAKTLHVGHLRSPNIGEALKRLCKLCGYEVISDVHLGDFGRQMGMVILEIRGRFPDLVFFKEDYEGEYPTDIPISNKDLESIYPIANNKCKENPEYMEEARDITNKLQMGVPGYRALWKAIVKLSVEDIKNLYDNLNADFDYWYGESDSYSYIKELTKYLEGIDILRMSDGAVIIDVKEDSDKKDIPPFIYIKSNGAVSYEATDLATIYQRVKEFNPDSIWYVVDNRQELHFIQTFRAAYKSKIVNPNIELEFLGFGTMNGKDGKPFKTRDGGVMNLNTLLNEVKEETIKLVSDGDDKDSISKMVSIAALKYADLLPTRSKDYIFDIEKFCDMHGKTGPYILYSTVRISSLLKKSNCDSFNYHNIYNSYDMDVLLNILDLSRVVDNSLKSRSLSDICEYLFRLNNSYNNFYNECRILGEEDSIKRESWLALSKIVNDIDRLLLDVLAIDIPNRM